MPNEWMESRIQQLHIDNERQKRDMEARRISEDPSLWMSAGTNDDPSKRLLMELLHQKPNNQSTETLDVNVNNMVAFESRESFGSHSAMNSNHSFNLLNQEVGVNHPFAGASYGSNSGTASQGQFVNETVSGLEGNNRLFTRSNSDINESPIEKSFFDLEGKSQLPRSEGNMVKGVAGEIQEGIVQQGGATATVIGLGEIPNNVARHTSPVIGGNKILYNDKVGPLESFAGEAIDRVSSTSKRSDNILLKRPPVSQASSSHEALSELTSDSSFRGRNDSSMTLSEVGRRETGENVAEANSKKEVGFRRTSSMSDTDVSETASFSDMLKSNVKKPPVTPRKNGNTRCAATEYRELRLQ